MTINHFLCFVSSVAVFFSPHLHGAAVVLSFLPKRFLFTGPRVPSPHFCAFLIICYVLILSKDLVTSLHVDLRGRTAAMMESHRSLWAPRWADSRLWINYNEATQRLRWRLASSVTIAKFTFDSLGGRGGKRFALYHVNYSNAQVINHPLSFSTSRQNSFQTETNSGSHINSSKRPWGW